MSAATHPTIELGTVGFCVVLSVALVDKSSLYRALHLPVGQSTIPMQPHGAATTLELSTSRSIMHTYFTIIQ